jgi:limonene-1,2-epoxide hydrolase
MRSVMEAVLASRDIVIIYQTITFEAKATGQTGTLPVCELFRFRDGKVIEWRAHYFDACMVAKAIKGDS